MKESIEFGEFLAKYYVPVIKDGIRIYWKKDYISKEVFTTANLYKKFKNKFENI